VLEELAVAVAVQTLVLVQKLRVLEHKEAVAHRTAVVQVVLERSIQAVVVRLEVLPQLLRELRVLLVVLV
jgi:hypothetical protein